MRSLTVLRPLLRGRPKGVASQARELRQCKIDITPFDCPRDNSVLSPMATRRRAMASSLVTRSVIGAGHGQVVQPLPPSIAASPATAASEMFGCTWLALLAVVRQLAP